MHGEVARRLRQSRGLGPMGRLLQCLLLGAWAAQAIGK